MQKAFYPALLLLLFLSPACSIFGDDDMTDFQQQRSKWEQQALLNYEYTLNVACFCPYSGPVRVDVRADSIYTATVVETDEVITNLEAFNVKTIDGLFEVLGNALKNADEVEVDYDAQYGFPTRMAIDYYKDAVDDEISYRATDLQVGRIN